MSTFTVTPTVARRPFSEIFDEAIAAGEIVDRRGDLVSLRTSLGPMWTTADDPALPTSAVA